MAKTKTAVKKVSKKLSVPKKIGGSKAKEPKFKLISYTLKAVIPTGMYANIQPEVTVQARTIQEAERAVMPYIEALFAKYRSDTQVVVTPSTPVRPAPSQAPAQAQKPVEAPKATVAQPTAQAKPTAEVKAPEAPAKPVETTSAPIELSVPFQRAEAAVKSCTSKEALKLVTDQITKSVKLTQEEKNTLIMLATDKSKEFNG